MASYKFTSLFVLATALLLLVSATSAGPEQPTGEINPLCKTADRKRLCNRMVRGATNLQDASVNAIKSTLALVKRINNMESELKAAMADVSPSNQKMITEACQMDMKKKYEDLQSSLTAIKANDVGSVTSKLSAGTASPCFAEITKSKKRGFDINSLFYKKVALLKPEYSNCLAVVQQK